MNHEKKRSSKSKNPKNLPVEKEDKSPLWKNHFKAEMSSFCWNSNSKQRSPSFSGNEIIIFRQYQEYGLVRCSLIKKRSDMTLLTLVNSYESVSMENTNFWRAQFEKVKFRRFPCKKWVQISDSRLITWNRSLQGKIDWQYWERNPIELATGSYDSLNWNTEYEKRYFQLNLKLELQDTVCREKFGPKINWKRKMEHFSQFWTYSDGQ